MVENYSTIHQEAGNAAPGHRALSAAPPETREQRRLKARALRAALDVVLPPPIRGMGRRKAMLAWFEGRADRSTIFNYLACRRGIPPWIQDKARRELEHWRDVLAAPPDQPWLKR